MINRFIKQTSSLFKTIQNSYQSIYLNSRIIYSYSHQHAQTSRTELQKYEEFLVKHNLSLKKPHQKLRTEEERIIKSYVEEERYSQIVHFLSKNSGYRFCNINTAFFLDKHLLSVFDKLKEKDCVYAAHGLISLRVNNFFNMFKDKIEQKLKKNHIQQIQLQELIVYFYGQIILNKNMNFINAIVNDKNKLSLSTISTYLSCRNYRGEFVKEYAGIKQYLELFLNSHFNKIEEKKQGKLKKTPLEIDAESFLTVLGYKFKSEVLVNSYKVDYVVETSKGQVALEMNGNYHYTLNNKLKGRQFIRNLIVNECMPLRILHHQDLMLSKGHRNKIAYIDSIIKSPQVNWECRRKGMDSGWQVTEVQDLIKNDA